MQRALGMPNAKRPQEFTIAANVFASVFPSASASEGNPSLGGALPYISATKEDLGRHNLALPLLDVLSALQGAAKGSDRGKS